MRGVVALVLIIEATIASGAPYYGKLIGDFINPAHGVMGTVRAADSKTIVIENFHYDGLGPDAYIWVGTTDEPSVSGTIVPAFEGDNSKLGAYTGQRIVAKLQGSMTVADYKWISIWCRMANANFGNVFLPDNFANPAEDNLGRLPTLAHGVRADSVTIRDSKTVVFANLYYDGNGPDAYFWGDPVTPPTTSGIKLIWKTGSSNVGQNQRITDAFTGQTVTVTIPGDMTVYDFTNLGLWCVLARQDFGHVEYNRETLNVPAKFDVGPPPMFPNCKVLKDDELQVQWAIKDSKLEVELASRVGPGMYMAFGLSGADDRTLMDGSDVVVAWMDETSMSPKVVDYNLQSKAQCGVNDGHGACPDDIPSVNGTNDVTLVYLQFGNGITRIAYSRALDTGDNVDKVIPTDREVYISWAIGPINPDGRVAKHTSVPIDNPQINFGTDITSRCPEFTSSTDNGNKLPAWSPSTIKDVTTFEVDIGQSGGERGYTGITGDTGWGIAWYANGLLIPEITLKRGVNYTFKVYGGNDPEKSAEYHPFYITDDPNGGYVQKTTAEKDKVNIYAGPTVGPLCLWEVKQVGVSPDDFDNFNDYKQNLQRTCVGTGTDGGKMYWVPDGATPDLVYYQCYTHRFLGWKIHISSASGVRMSLYLLVAMLGVVTLF